MSKFKAGDVVKCVTNERWCATFGKKYEVISTYGDQVKFIDDDGDNNWYNNDTFELVTADKKVVEVGDKIRIIENSSHNFSVGAIVTVDSVREDGTCYLAVGFCPDRNREDSQFISENHYELIEQKPVIDFTKPLQTKKGKPVTIITTKGRANYPVVAYIADASSPSSFTKDGKYFKFSDSDEDLENVPEKKVEHVRYYNIYHEFITYNHLSRADADNAAEAERIGCKRVVFTEGEFDD